MQNERRRKTRKRFGFDTEAEINREKQIKREAAKWRKEDTNRREEIEKSQMYQVLIKGAIGFDIADALLGILEIGGDLLSGVLGLAYVILSLSVVKSIRLTFAVACVAIIDFLIGLIPVAGSAVDVLFCGNYINRTLIKGFVEGNETIRNRINLISIIGFFVIAIAVWLLHRMFSL